MPARVDEGIDPYYHVTISTLCAPVARGFPDAPVCTTNYARCSIEFVGAAILPPVAPSLISVPVTQSPYDGIRRYGGKNRCQAGGRLPPLRCITKVRTLRFVMVAKYETGQGESALPRCICCCRTNCRGRCPLLRCPKFVARIRSPNFDRGHSLLLASSATGGARNRPIDTCRHHRHGINSIISAQASCFCLSYVPHIL